MILVNNMSRRWEYVATTIPYISIQAEDPLLNYILNSQESYQDQPAGQQCIYDYMFIEGGPMIWFCL